MFTGFLYCFTCDCKHNGHLDLASIFTQMIIFVKVCHLAGTISPLTLPQYLSRLSVPKRVFRSFFHILDVSVAYILMLLVMTFNIYILISVITGAGLGHFFFRPLFFSRINARLRRCQRVLQILHSPSEEQACVHCTHDSSTDHDESNRMSTITSKGKEEECKVTLIVEDTSKAESQQFVVKGKETCVWGSLWIKPFCTAISAVSYHMHLQKSSLCLMYCKIHQMI